MKTDNLQRPPQPPRSSAARFWIFRLATYFVIACASYIFLDIGIKGSRTVFTAKAPFINFAFLTEGPQTLYVFEYEGKKLTLGDQEFRAWKATHPDAVVAPQTVAYSAGGIWPCIVGTALLVIGSMTLALFIGISSAIYPERIQPRADRSFASSASRFSISPACPRSFSGSSVSGFSSFSSAGTFRCSPAGSRSGS